MRLSITDLQKVITKTPELRKLLSAQLDHPRKPRSERYTVGGATCRAFWSTMEGAVFRCKVAEAIYPDTYSRGALFDATLLVLCNLWEDRQA